MKKNSLNVKIWKYFLVFAVLVLGLLWLFQVLFLNRYYRYKKVKDIRQVASTIKNRQNSEKFLSIVNNLADRKEVCVEIINDNYIALSSFFYGKGCFSDKNISMNYKYDFIMSGEDEKTYELINPKYNNNTLIYAMRLQDNSYTFINSSLEPIDETVGIIREQLIFITVIVLVASLVISYFISNHISSPIVRINAEAGKLSKGDFNINFKDDSNIMEIDELARTLNYTSKELEKTDELRRDLMANVSHDLKTPLTMIKAYAEMSKDLHSNSKKKRKEDMDIVIQEVDRLTVLVDDILLLSKMQSNIDKLDYEEFDLIDLIREVLKRYSFLVDKENYVFCLETSLEKITIKADKKKMEQVIYNLINNAINYTGEDKKVKVRVSEENDNFLIEVIDTGKGIRDEDLPHIWDRYYKNQKKHKRGLVGTGLGLSIVKNILELHGYSYGVSSSVGHGSCFYFKVKKKGF